MSHFDQYISWYNNDHMHMGLNLHTPASVHFGWVDGIVKRRQDVMDAAYAANPQRFPAGRPVVKANPAVVGINLNLKAVQVAAAVEGTSTQESDALHSADSVH